MKRLLAIVLVVVVLIGCCQVSALGDQDTNDEVMGDTFGNMTEEQYDPEIDKQLLEDIQEEDFGLQGVTDDARFVVLVLDSSIKTEGKILDAEKQAALLFCETAMRSDEAYYIAIVSISTNPCVVCTFTDDVESIHKAVNDIQSGGQRNVNTALALAEGLLSREKKNNAEMDSADIILFSTGLPDAGETSDSKFYTGESAGFSEKTFETAKRIKEEECNLFVVRVFNEDAEVDIEQWTTLVDDITRGERIIDDSEDEPNANVFELIILNEPINEDEDLYFDDVSLSQFWADEVLSQIQDDDIVDTENAQHDPESVDDLREQSAIEQSDQDTYDDLVAQAITNNTPEATPQIGGEVVIVSEEDENIELEATLHQEPDEQVIANPVDSYDEPENTSLPEPDTEPDSEIVQEVKTEEVVSNEDPVLGSAAMEHALETEPPEVQEEERAIDNEEPISLDGGQESELLHISGNGSVRFNVLILDTSGSMSGTPEDIQKQAALKFCESVLRAQGENFVAIVSLNSHANTVCDFTSDINVLETAVNNMYASGGTNINEALEAASALMDSAVAIYPEGIRNIILCSDGCPESGSIALFGHYSIFDSLSYYAYANKAYSTAETIKEKGDTIYSLGFFHSLSGSELNFGRRVLLDISSGSNFYFEIVDANDLEFTFGEVAETITDQGAEAVEFHYSSGGDYTATCYYTDNYFQESAYDFNISLATMSLSFAMSAFGSDRTEDYRDKSMNARDLLIELGFPADQIATNDWYTVKPTTDSIGLVVGSKQMEDDGETYTLIAMAVRGGGYGREWASNFTIGTSGQHQGFNEAKEEAIQFLQSYISTHSIEGKVKFWITGYSRAAATANLVGGALDQGVSFANINYDNDDVFVYTFETPAGAREEDDIHNEKFNNIYNIINLSDPVPYVAPEYMGFDRYGIDWFLPSAQTTSNYWVQCDYMLQQYESLPSQTRIDYVVDDFKMKKLDLTIDLFGEGIKIVQDDIQNPFSQGVFLSQYVTIISAEFIRSRENYVKSYQDDIREVCKVCFGFEDGPLEDFVNAFLKEAEEHWADLIIPIITNNNSFLIQSRSADDVILEWLQAALQETGISDIDSGQLAQAAADLSILAIDLAVSHPNYLTTAIANGSGLGAAHYPELCWAWLSSMDPNYNGKLLSLNNGNYRIIHINCEVDVTVTDDNGDVIASIINDEGQDVGTSILCGVDADGQKIVILPIDEEFNIDIIGRVDDEVSYGISEYSAGAGNVVRNINYFDVPVMAGETLEANVPAYTDYEIKTDTLMGSSVTYTLLDNNGDPVEPDSDLLGDDASTYYDVVVSAYDDNMGIVSGSGLRLYGDYAMVEAFPAEGYVFEAWQDNGTPVSNEAEYRFCVMEDTSLVAVFRESEPTTTPTPAPNTPIPTPTATQNTPTPQTVVVTTAPQGINSWTITFDPNGGETDITSASTNTDGFLTSLPIPTKDGFDFAGWCDENGKTISTSTMFTRDQTIQACWVEGGEGVYLVAVGADGTWVKGSHQDFTFTLAGDLDSIRSIAVDGSNIRANAYSVDANNRNITIVSGYLEGLPVGEHEFSFTFKDGECSAILHVINAAATPSPTADIVSAPVETTSSSNKTFTVVILIVLFLACAGGVVAAVMIWRTKKKREEQKYYTDRSDPWARQLDNK